MAGHHSTAIVQFNRERNIMSLDIHCPHCGEPTDMYELHDVYDSNDNQVPYQTAAKQFALVGCGVWNNNQKCAASVVDQDMADRARVMMVLSDHPDEWMY